MACRSEAEIEAMYASAQASQSDWVAPLRWVLNLNESATEQAGHPQGISEGQLPHSVARSSARNKARFPIYIVSKGRWHPERRLTIRTLDEMRQPFRVIVEASEADAYAREIGKDRVLMLPQAYKDSYDTFWPRPAPNKTGSGAARNFAWDHSVSEGAEFHWVLDDNIDGWYRLQHNLRHKVISGVAFRAVEDFVSRYENIAISGHQYLMFLPRKYYFPAFTLNGKIYSSILIRNSTPLRWRGLYNEDVDLCLRALKAGWCTATINVFCANKIRTQLMGGGNTDELYRQGTLDKSRMLAEMHPDVAKVTHKFGRDHHQVNWRAFRANHLRPREGVHVPDGFDDYGLQLRKVA
jgi:hypothetical protein